MTAHPHRLLTSEGEEGAVERQGVPVQLVRPPGKVPPHRDRMGEIPARRLQGLPVVKSLEPGQVLLVPLDQVGHLVQEPASDSGGVDSLDMEDVLPVGGVHRAPLRSQLEGATSGFHCEVHVLFPTLGHLDLSTINNLAKLNIQILGTLHIGSSVAGLIVV